MKAVTFYFEWRKAMKSLGDRERLFMYDAILDYAENGVRPGGMTGAMEMAFDIIASAIDHDAERYQAVSEARSIAGKKGNAARWGSKTSGDSEENNRNCDICESQKSQKSQNRDKEKEQDEKKESTKEIKEEIEEKKKRTDGLKRSPERTIARTDAQDRTGLSFDDFKEAFGKCTKGYGIQTQAAWTQLNDKQRMAIMQDLKGERKQVREDKPYFTITDFRFPEPKLYHNGEMALTEQLRAGVPMVLIEKSGTFAYCEAVDLGDCQAVGWKAFRRM